MSNPDSRAVGGPLDGTVRPYATSVTWRDSIGGVVWQQWHDDDDPMPDEWEESPPDEVVHVYSADQVSKMLAAERERMNAHAVTLANTERLVERERIAQLCRAMMPIEGVIRRTLLDLERAILEA